MTYKTYNAYSRGNVIYNEYDGGYRCESPRFKSYIGSSSTKPDYKRQSLSPKKLGLIQEDDPAISVRSGSIHDSSFSNSRVSKAPSVDYLTSPPRLDRVLSSDRDYISDISDVRLSDKGISAAAPDSFLGMDSVYSDAHKYSAGNMARAPGRMNAVPVDDAYDSSTIRLDVSASYDYPPPYQGKKIPPNRMNRPILKDRCTNVNMPLERFVGPDDSSTVYADSRYTRSDTPAKKAKTPVPKKGPKYRTVLARSPCVYVYADSQTNSDYSSANNDKRFDRPFPVPPKVVRKIHDSESAESSNYPHGSNHTGLRKRDDLGGHNILHGSDRLIHKNGNRGYAVADSYEGPRRKTFSPTELHSAPNRYSPNRMHGHETRSYENSRPGVSKQIYERGSKLKARYGEKYSKELSGIPMGGRNQRESYIPDESDQTDSIASINPLSEPLDHSCSILSDQSYSAAFSKFSDMESNLDPFPAAKIHTKTSGMKGKVDYRRAVKLAAPPYADGRKPKSVPMEYDSSSIRQANEVSPSFLGVGRKDRYSRAANSSVASSIASEDIIILDDSYEGPPPSEAVKSDVYEYDDTASGFGPPNMEKFFVDVPRGKVPSEEKIGGRSTAKSGMGQQGRDYPNNPRDKELGNGRYSVASKYESDREGVSQKTKKLANAECYPPYSRGGQGSRRSDNFSRGTGEVEGTAPSAHKMSIKESNPAAIMGSGDRANRDYAGVAGRADIRAPKNKAPHGTKGYDESEASWVSVDNPRSSPAHDRSYRNGRVDGNSYYSHLYSEVSPVEFPRAYEYERGVLRYNIGDESDLVKRTLRASPKANPRGSESPRRSQGFVSRNRSSLYAMDRVKHQ